MGVMSDGTCANHLLPTNKGEAQVMVIIIIGNYPSSTNLSDKAVLGLELLGEIHGVVDQTEPGGLATSEVGLEPECENSVGCAVVHLGQLLTDLYKEIRTKIYED